MLLLDLSSCGPSGILRAIYFFKLILDIVFIIIPIGLIIMLIIDFSKAMISSDEGTQKKTFKLAMKRILYAAIVFFVPTIVSIVNSVLGELGVDYSVCYNDISIEAINQLEAEEIAIEEAQKAARLALYEQQREDSESVDNFKISINNGEVNILEDSGCDGKVYYENGIFYKPSGLGGKEGTKGSAYTGHNKYFYAMLTEFFEAAKAAGHDISPDDNAWRDYYEQEVLYGYYIACNKKGSLTREEKCAQCDNCGNLAASPGTSNHNWAIASDLIYNSNRSAAVAWAKENAYKYNLIFSVPSEDWHIEPAQIQINDSKVNEKCK